MELSALRMYRRGRDHKISISMYRFCSKFWYFVESKVWSKSLIQGGLLVAINVFPCPQPVFCQLFCCSAHNTFLARNSSLIWDVVFFYVHGIFGSPYRVHWDTYRYLAFQLLKVLRTEGAIALQNRYVTAFRWLTDRLVNVIVHNAGGNSARVVDHSRNTPFSTSSLTVLSAVI